MSDRFSERAVVLFLGTFALIGIGGLIWLIDHGSVKDAALLAIIAGPTGGALGSMGTLLARVGGTQDVRVANTPNDPVPVDPEAGVIDKTFLVLCFIAVCVGLTTWHYLGVNP